MTVRGASPLPTAEIGITECSGDPRRIWRSVFGLRLGDRRPKRRLRDHVPPLDASSAGLFSPAVDCASAATPCVLTVFDSFDGSGGDGQSIPLFRSTRSSVALPPPHLLAEVSPDDHLHDNGSRCAVLCSARPPDRCFPSVLGTATSIGDCDFSATVVRDYRWSWPVHLVGHREDRGPNILQSGRRWSEVVVRFWRSVLPTTSRAAVAPLSFDIPEIDLHGVSVREGDRRGDPRTGGDRAVGPGSRSRDRALESVRGRATQCRLDLLWWGR